MKKLFLIIPLIFMGCSVNNAPTKVKEFAKCYVHKLPAPFWICYETSFMAVGKVHAKKFTRLEQQEAYAVGIKSLSEKILNKAKKFLRKINYKNNEILQKIKSFVIMNAINNGVWYDKKSKILYVKVTIDKNEFKKFLFSQLKGYDKKVLEVAFNESF